MNEIATIFVLSIVFALILTAIAVMVILNIMGKTIDERDETIAAQEFEIQQLTNPKQVTERLFESFSYDAYVFDQDEEPFPPSAQRIAAWEAAGRNWSDMFDHTTQHTVLVNAVELNDAGSILSNEFSVVIREGWSGPRVKHTFNNVVEWLIFIQEQREAGNTIAETYIGSHMVSN